MEFLWSDLQEYVKMRHYESLDRKARMIKCEEEIIDLKLKQTLFKRGEPEREMELLMHRTETGVTKFEMDNKSLRPNLPKVEEQKDDMVAYIHAERFQQLAKIQVW